MAEEVKVKEKKTVQTGGVSSAVYGLGLIGALIYFLQHAANFQSGLIGVLKAIVWPSFVVYKLLEFLKI